MATFFKVTFGKGAAASDADKSAVESGAQVAPAGTTMDTAHAQCSGPPAPSSAPSSAPSEESAPAAHAQHSMAAHNAVAPHAAQQLEQQGGPHGDQHRLTPAEVAAAILGAPAGGSERRRGQRTKRKRSQQLPGTAAEFAAAFAPFIAPHHS